MSASTRKLPITSGFRWSCAKATEATFNGSPRFVYADSGEFVDYCTGASIVGAAS